MTLDWDSHLSAAARQLRPSATRELFRMAQGKKLISLAGGLPSAECFPVQRISDATTRVLAERSFNALQYASTQGEAPLLEFLVGYMNTLGVTVDQSQVLVTASSMQGLDIMGRLMIDPQSPVGIEDPTYAGAIMGFNPYQPRYVTLPMDNDGLDVSALEAVLAGGEKLRFVYLMSCFQNPTGVTLSPQRRRALLQLCAKYGLVIVEDDPYGELYYTGTRPQPLAALDIEMHGELQHVIYLSTFSKIIAPGLRVGWVAAPKGIIEKIGLAKQAMDLHTSPFTQLIIHEVFKDGFLTQQLDHIRQVNSVRRTAMLDALDEHMPPGVAWTKPEGGMFLWLTLPDGLDDWTVLRGAVAKGVTFVPGSAYYAHGQVHNAMRLSFTQPTPDEIEQAIARLGAVLREAMAPADKTVL